MHKRRVHQRMDESLLIYIIRYTTILIWLNKCGPSQNAYLSYSNSYNLPKKRAKHKGLYCKELSLSYNILDHYIKAFANPRLMHDRMVIFINAI